MATKKRHRTCFPRLLGKEKIMLSLGFVMWFPIGIVLSAILVAISIPILEKIQAKFLQLNKKKVM
jgi:hypothetical protein